MTQKNIRQCERGSAEQVILHAKWRRRNGRRPTMGYLNEMNPAKALRLASVVVAGVRRSKLVSKIAAVIIERKTYDTMNDKEIEVAARHIIQDSVTEDEVRRRLREELGYRYNVALSITLPTDDVGRGARELVRGIGGLVMKNGAMVMAMLHGHEDTISI